jgi:hypothetical protein
MTEELTNPLNTPNGGRHAAADAGSHNAGPTAYGVVGYDGGKDTLTVWMEHRLDSSPTSIVIRRCGSCWRCWWASGWAIQAATVLAGTTIISAAERFGSSGFVAETVPLALFAASHRLARSFEEVIAQLVDIDGDTDTIAAIAGRVAGAHIGYSRIPQNLSPLPPIREIFPKAQAFALGYGLAWTGVVDHLKTERFGLERLGDGPPLPGSPPSGRCDRGPVTRSLLCILAQAIELRRVDAQLERIA